MRSIRRISLPAHGLVELVAGLALVVGAFALDLGGAGTVLTFLAGVSIAGLGLGAADSVSLDVHRSLDRWMVIALALASIVAASQGSALAGVVLLGVALMLLALQAATRWTRAPLFN